jgi:hypothetical protein
MLLPKPQYCAAIGGNSLIRFLPSPFHIAGKALIATNLLPKETRGALSAKFAGVRRRVNASPNIKNLIDPRWWNFKFEGALLISGSRDVHIDPLCAMWM